jgi:hypothetical protein
VREDVLTQVQADLRRGAVFYDLHRAEPTRLDVFSAAIHDGRGHVLHRRLYVAQARADSVLSVAPPTLFLDLAPAPSGTPVPDAAGWPGRDQAERALVELALGGFLAEVAGQRAREIKVIAEHIEISLGELIHRQNLQMAQLFEQKERHGTGPLVAANIKNVEDRLDELNHRLERRRAELEQERHCAVSDVQHLGSAWVLPHPERQSADVGPLVADADIERIAVQAAIAYEEARGWQVESVESENRGFDLISRRPHPEDPATAVEVRFIEVKGRAGMGDVLLSSNEYKTAERLKQDFWLYVVYNCATAPEVHVVQDPARLGWKPIVKVEHYVLGARQLMEDSHG